MDSEDQQICRDFVRPVILPLLNRQTPEKQAFRGVCPHPGLIFCTLLPLLGTLATIPPPSFLSNSTIATNVGYQNQDLTGKPSPSIGCTFVGVGSEKFKLGDVAVTGFKYDSETLQVLSDENAATIARYTYVTPEWDEEDFEGDGAAVGWWIKGKEGETGYSADTVVWPAGQAMLGNFGAKKVKLTFPSAF